MAYLCEKGIKKSVMCSQVANELSLPTIPNMTLLEIMKLILRSDNYDEEETRYILDIVRGKREDAEKWERLGGKPATSRNEPFYCETKGYQIHTDNESGFEKNSVKLTALEIMSLVHASEAFNCKTDAKSEKIQHLNRDVVEVRIPELCSEDMLSHQKELDVSVGSEDFHKHQLSSTNDKICCRSHKMYENEIKESA
ncbi:hypothetical protein AVEN_228676-1 [Araneus ventricosus]|uniref:Uncharacterized protein n=1 Tax=Araneus ventricosus TaxID=182803 RepID=A0A4Y2KJU4_ARAVE|nr:hypothetical protein AVEN_228676-1 [Araneus ventricosus]